MIHICELVIGEFGRIVQLEYFEWDGLSSRMAEATMTWQLSFTFDTMHKTLGTIP